MLFAWALLPALLTVGPLTLVIYISARLELWYHYTDLFKERETGVSNFLLILRWNFYVLLLYCGVFYTEELTVWYHCLIGE